MLCYYGLWLSVRCPPSQFSRDSTHHFKVDVGLPQPPEICPGRANNLFWGHHPRTTSSHTTIPGESVLGAAETKLLWFLWTPVPGWALRMDPAASLQEASTCMVLPSSEAESTFKELNCPRLAVTDWQVRWQAVRQCVPWGHRYWAAGGSFWWQFWCLPVNHLLCLWWAMESKWFIEAGSWVKLECCAA